MTAAAALQKNSGTVQFDNPNRKVPYTRQASVGYERQFGAMTFTIKGKATFDKMKQSRDWQDAPRVRLLN